MNFTTTPTMTETEIYLDVADRLGTKGVAALSLAVTRAIQTAADGYLVQEFQAAIRNEITLVELCDALSVHLAVVKPLPEDWLMADDECNCFLPEQSCPACRKAAREAYAPDGEIPY